MFARSITKRVRVRGPLIRFAVAAAVLVASFANCGQDGTGLTTSSSSSGATGGSGGQGAAGGATSNGGGGGATSNGGAGGAGGAGGGFGGVGGNIDKSQGCATLSQYGNALTSPFGRIDGTVFAIVKPEDTQCDGVNNDHVVVEIKMLGDVYRMVTNVMSDQGPPDVYFLEKAAALPAPAWAEGWHLNAPLSYITDLGVHSTDFMTYNLVDLSNLITHRLDVGSKVSVYAATDGGYSAHLIHKNDGPPNMDGAIVIDADTNDPKFMLFHFDEMVF